MDISNVTQISYSTNIPTINFDINNIILALIPLYIAIVGILILLIFLCYNKHIRKVKIYVNSSSHKIKTNILILNIPKQPSKLSIVENGMLSPESPDYKPNINDFVLNK